MKFVCSKIRQNTIRNTIFIMDKFHNVSNICNIFLHSTTSVYRVITQCHRDIKKKERRFEIENAPNQHILIGATLFQIR